MTDFRPHIRILIALAILGSAIFFVVFTVGSQHTVTVAFLDVGQGDAIYIETQSGNQMLIDGGPDRLVLEQLGEVMPWWDRSIDILVVTHPDQDHIAGTIPILERYHVDRQFISGVDHGTVFTDAHSSVSQAKNVVTTVLWRGTRITLDHAVYLDILYPDTDVANFKPNSGSVVAQLVIGETKILLPGDIPQSIEQKVVDLDGQWLDSDILKIAHHGSKTSTNSRFLQAVSPEIAVISAGLDNRYGHPHSIVLERLENMEVEIRETAKEGNIVFEFEV